MAKQKKMQVKFKKMHPDAVLPSYALNGDAGMDLTIITDGKFVHSEEGQSLFYYIEYDTGIAVEIPEEHVGLVFPRSSISKKSLLLANAVGIIDNIFRGSIKLRFKVDYNVYRETEYNPDLSPALFQKGERAAQLIILPFPFIEPVLVDELSETERGEGGFGSTGK